MKQKKSNKFCGAALGELPKGKDCVVCDMFAKLMDGSGEKQSHCPAEQKIQLYRLKKHKTGR